MSKQTTIYRVRKQVDPYINCNRNSKIFDDAGALWERYRIYFPQGTSFIEEDKPYALTYNLHLHCHEHLKSIVLSLSSVLLDLPKILLYNFGYKLTKRDVVKEVDNINSLTTYLVFLMSYFKYVSTTDEFSKKELEEYKYMMNSLRKIKRVVRDNYSEFEAASVLNILSDLSLVDARANLQRLNLGYDEN